MIKRSLRLAALLLIAALVAISPLTGWPTAHAHGGVIIDGGFTDDYEWIAMASPFPVTPGETILTILVYDIETYAPINGLVPTLELARPSAPQPCCQDDTTLGPLPLVVDPVLYPGDYSNITLLLQEGTWSGRFTIDASDPAGTGKKTELFFSVDVKSPVEGEERPTPVDAPSISLTATAIAPNPYPAPQGNGVDDSSNDDSSNDDSSNDDGASDNSSDAITPVGASAVDNSAPGNTANDDNTDGNAADTDESENPDAGDGSTGAEGGDTAEEDAAASTPYPAPAEPEVPSGPAIQLPEGAPPDANTADQTGTGDRSWAADNIWLLAALALVPILLVIFWFLLSGNNDNEWTKESEE